MNAICTMGAADAALSLPGADTARDLAATSISPNTKRAYGAALDALEEWLDGSALDDGTLAGPPPHGTQRPGRAGERVDGAGSFNGRRDAGRRVEDGAHGRALRKTVK